MTDTAARMHEPEEPHDVSRPTPHHSIPYFLIFGLLIVLTVITVAIAMKRFDDEIINVLLALLVASVKASMVAMYFMHLKFEGKLIYLIAIVPLCLCVLLVVALIPDVIMTDPVKHPHSTSLHLFNSIGELFRNAGEPESTH
jgi:cytochrome c oxidase subunit IV